MILFEYNVFNFTEILSKLTPLNYILMTLLLITSYLTYKVNPSVFILIPILNLTVFINNFIVAEYGQIYAHLQTLLISICFLLLTLSFYRTEIYKIYHDIKFRYWLTSPRFNSRLPIEIHYNNTVIKTKSFDISLTGLFIEADLNNKIFKLDSKKNIDIIIHDNKKQIKLNVFITRKCMSRGHYPAGIGVKLNHTQETIFWNRKILNLSKA
jgi:hypothetical protein